MAADHLNGLIRYLGQDNWKECFEEVLGEHLGPALEAADITFEELGDILGPDVAMTLWGCAFEDFLGQDWDEGRNFVEVYLKRRGWKEGPRNSAYMRALKDSVMSLYEVSDIVPGQSLMAQDLLRGGKPVLVREGTATRTLRPWDRIAARLVPQDGHTTLAGGLLAYSQDACEDLAGHLYDVLRRKRGKAEFPKVRTEVLRDLAPMFTLTWLFRTLENMVEQSALPVLFNGDGENLVFHDICFPLVRGVTQKTVAEVLEKLPGLRSEGRSFWNWLRVPGQNKGVSSRSSHQDAQAQFLSSEMDDGSIVLGTLELKGRQLRLEVNSRSRAEQGQAMLKEALGDLVGAPLTQIMTAQQAMDERGRGEGGKTPDVQIPPEEEARILAEVLERHYRKTLDDVVPVLGNMTPRQAVRTAAGRRAVAAWLKQIESTTAALGRAEVTSSFNFDWMWDELGIAGLRE